eukprot:scaffold129_cov254-Pinguiococcus_pyrenoidosus.AAC.1
MMSIGRCKASRAHDSESVLRVQMSSVSCRPPFTGEAKREGASLDSLAFRKATCGAPEAYRLCAGHANSLSGWTAPHHHRLLSRHVRATQGHLVCMRNPRTSSAAALRRSAAEFPRARNTFWSSGEFGTSAARRRQRTLHFTAQQPPQ